ncbi:hypothetical protein [Streptomyces sp. NPDC014676]|uniref:hypothetical protein n=1 Tax=Streptomyces sp. NPDC014676 TaxID=3364879 RepID=UPI0036FE8D20
MRSRTAVQRAQVERFLGKTRAERTEEEAQRMHGELPASGCVETVRARARSLTDEAHAEALKAFDDTPDSDEKQFLLDLPFYMVERDSRTGAVPGAAGDGPAAVVEFGDGVGAADGAVDDPRELVDADTVRAASFTAPSGRPLRWPERRSPGRSRSRRSRPQPDLGRPVLSRGCLHWFRQPAATG